MRKLLAGIAASALLMALPGGTPAGAGPSQGGLSTDNIQYVTYVPFEVGTATGMSLFNKDKNMIVTGWKSFSIYDVSNVEAPALITTVPFGFEFENEDVATNGKIMLFSETLPNSVLHVWDIEDVSNPVEIAALDGAGDHTMSCILKCKWGYGSDGKVVDLRDPANPVLQEENWHELTELQGGGHDIEEFKNGFILTSPISDPLQIIDVRNPLKPKVLARGENPNPTGFLFHSGRWPNEGKDDFVLMQGEKNARTRCTENDGPFMTFDATEYKKTKTLTLIDTYKLRNGTVSDGNPPANGLGCSAHWFEEHPKFKNGGLVAMGAYEHGTRFLDIDKKGKITEVGWFFPFAGSTSAAYWVNKEIVYSIDYTRGIDILRWTDKV
ncbi:MAG TPA: hypothetical protein VNC78_11415 [Actinomycetota bacterium]|nr:hypothetical protein [Actinomycetota bacterium]